MTDAIADITSKLNELKERDGWSTISIDYHDGNALVPAGCSVKLYDHKSYGGAHAKNFGMAYSSALKRLNKERNKHEIK